jgi:hypothetical protein
MSEGGNGAAEGFDGSVATSGLYDATWTVAPDQQVDPFNAVGGRTLLSETGAFGNVSISLGGDVSFGSGAPELSSHGLEFNGTGAQVTLDTSNAYVCAFMVDVDLIAADGAELHIAGSMTVHWYPEGVGAINCP